MGSRKATIVVTIAVKAFTRLHAWTKKKAEVRPILVAIRIAELSNSCLNVITNAQKTISVMAVTLNARQGFSYQKWWHLINITLHPQTSVWKRKAQLTKLCANSHTVLRVVHNHPPLRLEKERKRPHILCIYEQHHSLCDMGISTPKDRKLCAGYKPTHISTNRYTRRSLV